MKAFVSAIVFLLGVAMAFGYPYLMATVPGSEIGEFSVFSRAGGFTSVDVVLAPEDAPVEVYVDIEAAGTPHFDARQAVLTLTVSKDGRTVLAEPITFEQAKVRDDTPQTPERIYRSRVGTIDPVEDGSSPYAFVTGRGDADEVDFGRAAVILHHGHGDADPRAQPAGFAIMAIGVVAFLLSLRGRGDRPPPNPNSKPPPRWGRAGADRTP